MASDALDGPSSVDVLLRAGFKSADTSLFILSEGFDPRCLTALRRFIDAIGGVPHVLAIDPQPRDVSPDRDTIGHRRRHSQELDELVGDRLQRLPYPEAHDPSSVGRIIAQQITAESVLRGIEAVAVDISAFPTSLSFPPLRALLDACLADWGPRELQVLVTENPNLDHRIRKSALGAARPLAGFGKPRISRAPGESQKDPVNIWTPILGTGGQDTLLAIADFINPTEVCPVLPFPAASDPHLPDTILAAHRELLIDRFEIGPNNLIYAAEANPFDLYRTLSRFTTDYSITLEPLGGALVHVSVHGSKLLSIGALLAAYECDLPVISMRANHYSLDEAQFSAGYRESDQVTSLWLRGAPYLP